MEKQLLGLYNLFTEVFNYNASCDIVTPLELARKMLKDAPVDGTLLIPGSGIGTFAVAAVLEGRNPCTITCVEYNKTYHAMGSRILERFGITCVHSDFLMWNPSIQFDAIVGNPPYQKLREVRNIGAPVWPLFIEKSMSLLKDGGHLDYLVPATWMNRKSKGAWKYISPYNLTYVDPDMKEHFPEVGGNGGTFSRLILKKEPYGGVTSICDKFKVNFHTDNIPENNKLLTKESLHFLEKTTPNTLELDVKSGPIKPSINSDHWSFEKTETHIYNVYYSGDPKRRSIWCDLPVGDPGKLKLVVASSGKVYDTYEITDKGVGRQANYVLGTLQELELIRDKMLTENSKRLCALKTAGNFTDPLRSIVK